MSPQSRGAFCQRMLRDTTGGSRGEPLTGDAASPCHGGEGHQHHIMLLDLQRRQQHEQEDTDPKYPYVAANRCTFPGATFSSAFLPNVGCEHPHSAMNVDNVCVGGHTASLPWQKRTPALEHEAGVYDSLSAEPMFSHFPLNAAQVKLVLRAAPLPSSRSGVWGPQ